MFDLRLLGLSRDLPVAALAAHLLPWARGSAWAWWRCPAPLMFTAHATEMGENPAFRLKLLLIVAAGLNAWAFHRWPFRSVARWNRDLPAPPRARVAAGCPSCCGRP